MTDNSKAPLMRQHEKGLENCSNSQTSNATLPSMPSQVQPNQSTRKAFWIHQSDGVPTRFWVKGRDRWALERLIEAGPTGVTPITHPAPRWSAYVHNLRKKCGLGIETNHEPHGGPFSGTHARYVLRSKVTEVSE